jgi:hypothetical protein
MVGKLARGFCIMKWTGGCLCGAISFEGRGTPGKNSGYCHCRMCQKNYGNGFTTFVEHPAETFRVSRGEPAIFRSSNASERGFC